MIHAAIIDVMRAVGGVAKRDRNAAQGFNFRGIDAVMNAVGPALREHGVFVTPKVLHLDQSEYTTGKNNTRMRSVVLTVEFTFHATDGSHVTATVCGEAADSGDKAVSKAHSVAFRGALLQVLCLPTDEPDPDETTAPRNQPKGLDVNAAKQAVLAAAGDKEKAAEAWATLGDTPTRESVKALIAALAANQ